jgi:Helix-turn-helix
VWEGVKEMKDGLGYILEVFHTNANQLSQEIGISRFTIYDWIKGRRPIPPKRVKELSEHFNIDEKWFNKKELLGSERLELQRIYIDRNAEFIEYTDYIEDEEGNVHEIPSYFSPDHDVSNHLYHEQKAKEVIEKVGQLIEIELNAHDDFYQEIFRKVITVTKTTNRNKVKMLNDVLNYLAYRDHEAGFMVLEDNDKTSKLDELMGLYEKK